MFFGLDLEQEQLRRLAREFFDARGNEAQLRAAIERPEGYDPAVWRALAADLGLAGLGVPAEVGGSGGGVFELGIVFEQAGRVAYPGPLLAAAAAAQFVLAADAPHLLPGICDGSSRVAVALPGSMPPGSPEIAGLRVTGACAWVAHGDRAETLLVTASAAEGPVLLALSAGAAGVTREPVENVDPTRRVGRWVLDGAAGTRIGRLTSESLRRAELVVGVLVAAEQLGVAQRALDDAVAYAKVRTQFGRAIGSFQAVKHQLASVLIEVESARVAVWYALWAADEAPHEFARAVAVAMTAAAEAARLSTAQNIQVHGGIGMTWEHSAHFFYKRAQVNRVLLGDPGRPLADLADAIDPLPA